jgi:hypothetical protein
VSLLKFLEQCWILQSFYYKCFVLSTDMFCFLLFQHFAGADVVFHRWLVLLCCGQSCHLVFCCFVSCFWWWINLCWKAFCHGQLLCGTGPCYQSVSLCAEVYSLMSDVWPLLLYYFCQICFVYLWLFNEAISNSNYRASNGIMIVESWTERNGKMSWFNLRYIQSQHLHRIGENMEHVRVFSVPSKHLPHTSPNCYNLSQLSWCYMHWTGVRI